MKKLLFFCTRPGFVLGLVASLALWGCGVLPSAGAASGSLDATRAQRGAPLAQYALNNGQRLFYRPSPYEVERLDFDANGRLVDKQIPLSNAAFAALAKSGGDVSDVQLQFGPPSGKKVQEEGELLWTYSWREFDIWRLARITFDKKGLLQRVEVVDDPQADDRYR